MTAVGNRSVNEQATLIFNATATDQDLPAQNLTFSLDAAALSAGMTINTTTGAFSFTPTESQGGMVLNATITVTDNGANVANLTSSETISITVNEVNVAPVLTAIGNQTVNEQATLTFTVAATDQDLPAQNLTFSLDTAALSAGMTINATTGAFSFTPTESQGGMVFNATITVTDNGANVANLTASETISITVNEVNVAPVLAAIGNQALDELTTLSFMAAASDADNPANALTFSLSGVVPAGASITPAGAFSWRPTAAQGPGVFTFDVVVTDDGMPNLSGRETITVAVNDSGTLTVEDVTVAEGGGLTFTVKLDNAVQGGFTVDVALADVTATGGVAPLVFPVDYNNLVARLNFNGTAGETRQFTVATLDDAVIEGTETFTVSLSASNPLIDDRDNATGTITDNDLLLVEFSQSTGMDVESSGANLPQLLVTGTIQAGHSVTINTAAIATSTATGSGVDYTNPTAVTVAGGIYSATAFAVPGLSITSDTLIESDETIDLGSPTGNQILVGDANGDGTTQATTQYTIIDDEEPLTAVVAGNASNLTIRDLVPGGKDDRLKLTISGGMLVITDVDNLLGNFTDNTTGHATEIPLDSITSVEIDLLAGNDELSIDFGGASPGFNLSVTINGGGGHDTLIFSGPIPLGSGALTTNDEVDDIFVNGPITTQGGSVSLKAMRDLEVNATINTGAGGNVSLTSSGHDIFGNCSLIQAGNADVQLVAGTGIAGVRVQTTGDVTLNSGRGGIIGCTGQITVSARTLTVLSDASVGTALLIAGHVTNVEPILTSINAVQGRVGGLGIFLLNDRPLTDSVVLVDPAPLGIRDVRSLPPSVAPESEGSPQQNAANGLDVNDDGVVSPIDVLAVVNYLNSLGSGAQSESVRHNQVQFYVDVNGDRFASALDALLVINHLNSQAGTLAEGESQGGGLEHPTNSAGQLLGSNLSMSDSDRSAVSTLRDCTGFASRWQTDELIGTLASSLSSFHSPRRFERVLVDDDIASQDWESLLDAIAADTSHSLAAWPHNRFHRALR